MSGEAEREEIDKRARELQSLGADVIAQHMLRVKMQRDMEDKMAKMSTAVAVVSARGGDRDLGGGCFVGEIRLWTLGLPRRYGTV